MPYAQVLTTASKAGTTGGTFADNLSANTLDSLSVANFNTQDPQGRGARVLEMWGCDSDSVAEFEFIWSRPFATHDQSHGYRVECPAIALGGAATNSAFNFLGGYDVINLFKSDTVTISVTSTASDDVLASWVTEYDDLPGSQAVFVSPGQVANLHQSKVGIFVGPTAGSTAGGYSATSRAFNADDDRLHANTWYALIGWTVQTQCTTISLIGPDWGGQRIGGPAGAPYLNSNSWFLDQSIKWNKPLIPCFNSNNKGNILVSVADTEASTQPKIDFNLTELTGAPIAGQ